LKGTPGSMAANPEVAQASVACGQSWRWTIN
jgi:hypothetical protein